MGDIALKPIELPELMFDEDTHTYLLNEVVIPSVTTVMKPLSSYEYGEIDEHILQTAANRGTAVHNAIENYLKYGIDSTDDEFRPYFEAFMDWYKETKPYVIGSEMRVYHKLYRYAGTLDMYAIIDGEPTIIDYKTTYRLIEKNCRVQTEAYAQALASHGVETKRKMILQLKKNGKFETKTFVEHDSEAWRVFGSLKCVYDFLQ